MTREEAHRILSNGLANAPSEHEWCAAFDMAIKALEQTDVLDKIRAEIQNNLREVDFMNEWADGYNSSIDDILAIIDKYRKEQK